MRNTILHSALQISMEGVDPYDNQEINPVTEETIVHVDEVLEEAREDSAVVEEHDEAIDELSQAADSLESLITSLESAIADGGLSPQAADIHSRAVAIATRRLPIDAGEFTVSVESFGGTGDKLQASMEAMEGAKALLSKIWEAIRSAFVGAWNAIKNFFATMGKSGPAVVAAGQSLKKRAQDAKGIKPAQTKISLNNAQFNYLITDGKFTPVASLTAINTGYDVGVKQYTSKIVSNLNPLYQAIERGELTPQRLDEAASKVDLKSAIPDDMKGKLPGGHFFHMTLSKAYVNGGTDLEVLAGASLKFEQDKAALVKNGQALEFDVLTVEEISKLADQIIEMGKLITSSKAVAGLVEKSIQQSAKAGNKLVSKEKTLSKEESAAAKKVLNALNKAARLSTGCSHQYLSYMGSAAKGAVSFGTQCLKQYTKAAKKAEA